MDGADQKGPKLWESTRFCLAPHAGAGAAARVLMAGQALGLAQGLEAAIGAHDARLSPFGMGAQLWVDYGLHTQKRIRHPVRQ